MTSRQDPAGGDPLPGPTDEAVTIEVDGRVAIVRLDRGKRANALSVHALQALTDAARGFHDRPDVSVVVLTGRSDGFSMGMDLKDPALHALRAEGLARRRISLRAGPRLCQAWAEVDAITICAIEHWCVGGGVALAAACDLRIVGRSATFYVPEVERGMNMSWGSIPRLTALLGPARAKRLAALCHKVDSATALQWGLVDAVVDDGHALEEALRWAGDATRLPPTAMKSVKHDVDAASAALFRATAHRDLEAFALLEGSDDFAEGVAAFLERREPRFSGD